MSASATHPLAKWLGAKGITMTAFADELGESRSLLERWMALQCGPPAHIVAWITKKTDGLVPASSWRVPTRKPPSAARRRREILEDLRRRLAKARKRDALSCEVPCDYLAAIIGEPEKV